MKTEDQPTISIVTANHNSARFIDETIKSVQAQSFSDWEMIIIDDNSSDEGIQIIEDYIKKDPRIKLLKNESNLGPAKTRNKGLEIAQGRYICFIDSDDLWYENFLEISLSYLQENSVGFVFSSYERKNEDFTKDNGTFYVHERVSYNDLLKTCPISCLTAMYDTKFTGKVYMPDVLKRQDFGLWLHILKKVPFAYGINQPMAIYRMRDNSVSRNKLHAAKYQWLIYRDVEKLSLYRSCLSLTQWAYFGFKKYY